MEEILYYDEQPTTQEIDLTQEAATDYDSFSDSRDQPSSASDDLEATQEIPSRVRPPPQSRQPSRRQVKSPTARAWVFTINNPIAGGDALKELLETQTHLVYCVWQYERGANGTPHMQGYVYLRGPRSRAYVSGMLGGGAFVATAQGNHDQNEFYCTKCCDECYRADRHSDCDNCMRIDGPWVVGTKPPGQGARNDLNAVAARLQSGASMQQIAQEFPQEMIRYGTGIYRFKRALPPPPMDHPRSISLWIGPTRTGKTYGATRIPGTDTADEDVFKKSPDEWFDNYNGQKKVVMDDFTGANCHVSVPLLLQLTDRYRHQVKIKGAYEWWLATEVIFTSNVHPYNWYRWTGRESMLEALAARFVEVRIFSVRGVAPQTISGIDNVKSFFLDPERWGFEKAPVYDRGAAGNVVV